ncbi:copper amine oxidase N-terminal domain-containing protein [Aneurinibacillus sp. Ricciae_BoGa-3]|uniref:copper amine oxidase N-terminal domain-containing protein n=1 Tax=Aneurinibacillus sp. Ricciae_BoGa-3 TaxID=3022697 RepID=UPI0023404CAD|nr:copper amine oxidase N-terminal domain-containing protein [Aneurinibacillus sp. Ricciae_BoGa-3]WCK55454.1 copper amine oxidase N-terminal domain-containing protein [Aneurinibacillus sp. Ricciae_BoGa-3]
MKKRVAVGIVSASLVLSATTVLAQPKSSNLRMTGESSDFLSKVSEFKNTFKQGNSQLLDSVLINSLGNKVAGQKQSNNDQNENNQDENQQQNGEQQNDDQDKQQQNEHHDEEHHNEHQNQEQVTTGDEIGITTGFTSEDQINVSPQTTSGDAVSINPTIKITTQMTVTFNGKTLSFDQQPIIKNGSTLVPLRQIFDSLGVKINWDGKSGTVKAQRGKQNVILKVGSSTATVNGKIVKLGQKAEIINKRTMIPLRFISESFGANVNWNGSNHTIDITEN